MEACSPPALHLDASRGGFDCCKENISWARGGRSVSLLSAMLGAGVSNTACESPVGSSKSISDEILAQRLENMERELRDTSGNDIRAYDRLARFLVKTGLRTRSQLPFSNKTRLSGADVAEAAIAHFSTLPEHRDDPRLADLISIVSDSFSSPRPDLWALLRSHQVCQRSVTRWVREAEHWVRFGQPGRALDVFNEAKRIFSGDARSLALLVEREEALIQDASKGTIRGNFTSGACDGPISLRDRAPVPGISGVVAPVSAVEATRLGMSLGFPPGGLMNQNGRSLSRPMAGGSRSLQIPDIDVLESEYNTMDGHPCAWRSLVTTQMRLEQNGQPVFGSITQVPEQTHQRLIVDGSISQALNAAVRRTDTGVGGGSVSGLQFDIEEDDISQDFAQVIVPSSAPTRFSAASPIVPRHSRRQLSFSFSQPNSDPDFGVPANESFPYGLPPPLIDMPVAPLPARVDTLRRGLRVTLCPRCTGAEVRHLYTNDLVPPAVDIDINIHSGTVRALLPSIPDYDSTRWQTIWTQLRDNPIYRRIPQPIDIPLCSTQCELASLPLLQSCWPALSLSNLLERLTPERRLRGITVAWIVSDFIVLAKRMTELGVAPPEGQQLLDSICLKLDVQGHSCSCPRARAPFNLQRCSDGVDGWGSDGLGLILLSFRIKCTNVVEEWNRAARLVIDSFFQAAGSAPPAFASLDTFLQTMAQKLDSCAQVVSDSVRDDWKVALTNRTFV